MGTVFEARILFFKRGDIRPSDDLRSYSDDCFVFTVRGVAKRRLVSFPIFFFARVPLPYTRFFAVLFFRELEETDASLRHLFPSARLLASSVGQRKNFFFCFFGSFRFPSGASSRAKKKQKDEDRGKETKETLGTRWETKRPQDNGTSVHQRCF